MKVIYYKSCDNCGRSIYDKDEMICPKCKNKSFIYKIAQPHYINQPNFYSNDPAAELTWLILGDEVFGSLQSAKRYYIEASHLVNTDKWTDQDVNIFVSPDIKNKQVKFIKQEIKK